MITRDEVFHIGRFLKPHGVKGEIALALDADVFDGHHYPYLVCDMDGILVPFFVRSVRNKGVDTALILFEDVTDEAHAHRFDGRDAYLHRSEFNGDEMEQENYSWRFFIGFTVIDLKAGTIGVIDEVDDDTANTLFIVLSPDGSEILIPAVEDLIESFDEESRIIRMSLPEGLLE